MPFASSNYESLGYEAESTYGTTVGTTKKFVNFTNHSLGSEVQYTNSNFVRSDTNIAGTILTAIDAGGDVGIELQYGGYDDFMEAALRGAFSTPLDISASNISFTASDNSINSSGAAFGNAVVGMWIKVTGAANAANNGYFKVVTATSSKLTLAGGTVVDESAGASITVDGSVCKNSTTQKSFSFERNWTDLTNQYDVIKGARVNSFGLNFPLNTIATGTINFLAKNATLATSTAFSGTTAAPTTQSMNSITNVKEIFIDNTTATYSFTNIDFSITTNSEALRVIGDSAAVDVQQNSIGVTGNFGIYMEDNALITKLRAATSIDLAFVVEDDAGNGYVFHFPEVKLTSGGTTPNEGVNNTKVQNIGFTAVYDPTLAITASVSKFPTP